MLNINGWPRFICSLNQKVNKLSCSFRSTAFDKSSPFSWLYLSFNVFVMVRKCDVSKPKCFVNSPRFHKKLSWHCGARLSHFRINRIHTWDSFHLGPRIATLFYVSNGCTSRSYIFYHSNCHFSQNLHTPVWSSNKTQCKKHADVTEWHKFTSCLQKYSSIRFCLQ